MKNKNLITLAILGVIVLFGIFSYLGKKQTSDHPTLNVSATMPDGYLHNVAYYEEEERHAMSAFNLEKAIESIWKLESDVDNESFEKLQSAISKLEEVHKSILMGSIGGKELKSSFEFALNNLAHAELEVAEMYAETNHMEQANAALKYAQLHIKNAMLFHDSFWDENEQKLAIEKHVFIEMDSLLENDAVSPMQYSLTVDKMIKEVDELLK